MKKYDKKNQIKTCEASSTINASILFLKKSILSDPALDNVQHIISALLSKLSTICLYFS